MSTASPDKHPLRACILCLKVFRRRRIEQVFCSVAETYECADKLRGYEDAVPIRVWVETLMRFDFKCWSCRREMAGTGGAVIRQSLGLLYPPDHVRCRPLFTYPYTLKWPPTVDDLVPSCQQCRSSHYRELSFGLARQDLTSHMISDTLISVPTETTAHTAVTTS